MKLPADFQMEMYGLHLRLINESDAQFIVALRNEEKARFMNVVQADVEQQKEWIRQYKVREENGIDYYFIYFQGDEPLGVNRLYNIKKDSFVGGSFVFKSDCEYDIPIKATLIHWHIAFEILKKSVSFGNIHKDNKKALKFNILLGSDLIYESEEEFYVVMTKNMLQDKRQKLEEMFI